MDGVKETLYVIGKSEKPRCLKVAALPMKYHPMMFCGFCYAFREVKGVMDDSDSVPINDSDIAEETIESALRPAEVI
jgi:hypothetical protein